MTEKTGWPGLRVALGIPLSTRLPVEKGAVRRVAILPQPQDQIGRYHKLGYCYYGVIIVGGFKLKIVEHRHLVEAAEEGEEVPNPHDRYSNSEGVRTLIEGWLDEEVTVASRQRSL